MVAARAGMSSHPLASSTQAPGSSAAALHELAAHAGVAASAEVIEQCAHLIRLGVTAQGLVAFLRECKEAKAREGTRAR